MTTPTPDQVDQGAATRATPTPTPTRTRSRWSGLERRVSSVAALVLVNVFAVIGQATWAYANLGHNPVIAGFFAATIESIALYLTSQASAAMLANDKAAGLRMAAYGVGVLVGAMNYQSHSVAWQPNATAITFGMLSAISPWLWAIQARRTHRDALAASGLIDPRTVKIPTALWLFYPTYAVGLLRIGVRNGINHLGTLRDMHAERRSLRELNGADAVRFAFGATGSYHTHQARVWLAQRGVHVKQTDLDIASAGRPSAPAVAPNVPTVSLGQDSTPGHGRDPYSGPDHDAALAALPTKREKIRYAFAHIGRPAVAEAVAFLADHGVKVVRSEVTALASAVRTTDPTGEHPAVTGTTLVPFRPSDPTPAPAHNGHDVLKGQSQ